MNGTDISKEQTSETEDNRTENRKTGDKAESAAAMFLERNGYKVMARNFRCRTGELDIIAVNPEERVIAFVEVKYRNSTEYGLPCQAVNRKKQQRLIRTAQYYLLKNPGLRTFQPRMDIIEILSISGNFYLRHLKDAFS